MTRLLPPAALLVACTFAFAQPVYKWTDENGHVHYGDRNDAPQAKTGTTLNLRARGAQPAASAGQGAASATDTVRASLPESSNLQRCLGMARAMADSGDTTPAVVRQKSRELLELCPDTAYDCTTYPRQPDRNTCQSSRLQAGGHILTNRVMN